MCFYFYKVIFQTMRILRGQFEQLSITMYKENMRFWVR